MTGSQKMSKLFLILGSINTATAVTKGAFGAHFLKSQKKGRAVYALPVLAR
jgi:uncharacterized membrane protein YgdD (TMEM256/DUF423 family)